ncbi:hypothetical protein [Agrobacterium pusense]|jgi:hypothetical protein|uniref:hypothetical protein n=1 Tax=Agrobacterium pusense TaxID=648995 RepID=UPI0037BFA7B7
MTDTSGEKDISPGQGWERTFNQMWELHFGPELERRKADGRIVETDFSVYMAQVLFPVEGPIQVRINDEVKGEALVRATRDVQRDDPVYVDDMRSIEIYELPDELLDSGHFTIFWTGDSWKMIFNFMSGRAKARDMLQLANEFLEASRHSRESGHAGPAVENLFTSAELISKAELILHRSPAASAETHGTVASAINIWSKLGNIDATFVALFNKLAHLRPNARYGDANSRPPMPAFEDYEIIEIM